MPKSTVLRCLHCTLEIQQRREDYCYKKTGLIVPTKLGDFNEIKRAYETRLCPICGSEMEEGNYTDCD